MTDNAKNSFMHVALGSCVWLAVGGLGLNAIWLAATPSPRATQSQGGAPTAAQSPYTVVLQEFSRSPLGETPQSAQTIALRSNGAVLYKIELLAGSHTVLQRTIDLPSGVSIVLDDVRELKTTTQKSNGTSFRARMDPGRGCTRSNEGTSLLRGDTASTTEVVSGYRTIKVLDGDTTYWFAPDVGCAMVKASTVFGDGSASEKVAILIAPGEPDEGLFRVPSRYQEVQHSVFYKLNPNSAEAQRLDRMYFERRPPK